MADTLTSGIQAKIDWSFGEALDLSTVRDAASLEFNKSLADGTAVDTADKVWHDTRSITAGANDDLDMTALTHSIFGSTVTISFAKIKAILIVNNSTTSGDELRIDTSVAAALLTPFASSATTKVEIGADSALLLSSKKDGWAVTNTTADIIRIHNPNAGTVSYSIVIIGTSA